MTQDNIDTLIEQCKAEGAAFFIAVTTDAGDNYRVFHNLGTLPEFRDYPDGARRTQKEDFMQLVESIPFLPT